MIAREPCLSCGTPYGFAYGPFRRPCRIHGLCKACDVRRKYVPKPRRTREPLPPYELARGHVPDDAEIEELCRAFRERVPRAMAGRSAARVRRGRVLGLGPRRRP